MAPVASVFHLGSLEGHELPVTNMCVHDRVMWSAGQDGRIFKWAEIPEQIQVEDRELNALRVAGNMVYYAAANSLMVYDVRQQTHSTLHIAEDEINQLDLHENKNFLGYCDDSGRVTVLDLRTKKPHKKFRSIHGNVCTTTKFKPKTGWEVWSGGMDCAVNQWDFSKGSNVSCLAFEGVTTGNQSMNPPHVHELAFDHSGRVSAAGLGDGSIKVLRQSAKKKSMVAEWTVEEIQPHSWSVTAMSWTEDGRLCSAGIDGKLAVSSFEGNKLSESLCVNVERKVNAIALLENNEDLTIAIGGTSRNGKYDIDLWKVLRPSF